MADIDKFELFWSNLLKTADNSNDEMTKSLVKVAPIFKGLVKEMFTGFLSKFEDLEKLTVSEMLSETLKKFEESLKQDEQFLRDISAKTIESVKPIQEIQDRNVQLEEKLKEALNLMHEREDKYESSLAKTSELVDKLTVENENLHKLNEEYKKTIQELEKQVKELKKELQDTRELALLRRFALNVEYELKALILAQNKLHWSEQKILNTELYVLEDMFTTAEAIKAVSFWFSEKKEIQQQYEDLKETLRWLKSYFTFLAHPVSSESFSILIFIVDGKLVDAKEMKRIVAGHIGKRNPTLSRTPFTLESTEVLQIALNSVDTLQTQRTNNNQTQFLFN